MSGSSDPKPAPASVEPPRVIPGLSTSNAPPPASKPRKRSAKKKDAATPFAGTVEGGATTSSDVPVPVETGAGVRGDDEDDDLVIPEKQTSAVEVVQKRIRSANKKIVRCLSVQRDARRSSRRADWTSLRSLPALHSTATHRGLRGEHDRSQPGSAARGPGKARPRGRHPRIDRASGRPQGALPPELSLCRMSR